MHPFYLFLLKSIAISGLFFAYYLLALKDKRLHTFNRCYLLCGICASLIIPLIKINWLNTQTPHALKLTDVLGEVQSGGEEEQIVSAARHGFQISPVIFSILLFFTVSLVLLVLLARQVAQVYKIKRRYPVTMLDGVCLVLTDLPEAPFSFMNNLFWRQGTAPDMAAQIQRHELTHIHQKHSYDKLFSQIVSAIFWVNPFFRLIGKELEMVHEYLADAATIEGDDTASFARLLLYNYGGSKQINATHSFFHSPIKRRLNMLTKPTNVALGRGRMLLALPLLAATLFLFSFSRKDKATIATQKTVLVIDAGHGGEDDGAVYNGLVEKDLNLRIAKMLAKLAKEQGIEVHMTREDDHYPTLQDRVSISNSFHPDAFISLHVNISSNNYSSNNYEVIVSRIAGPKTEKSKKLGAAVNAQLTALGISDLSLRQKGLHVLKANEAPAILIECGNMKQKAATDLIQSDERLEAFCTAILNGVVTWRAQ